MSFLVLAFNGCLFYNINYPKTGRKHHEKSRRKHHGKHHKQKSRHPFLALQLLTLSAAGCGGQSAAPKTESTADVSVTVQSTEEASAESSGPSLFEDLPVGDFGNAEMKFLGESGSLWAVTSLTSDTLDGEILNDAMYGIDRRIEDRLNVRLSSEYLKNANEFTGVVSKNVLAEDDPYDVYDISSHVAAPMIPKGYFREISDLDDLNLEKPWWDQMIHDSLTFNGKCYSMLGDVSVMLNESNYVLFYNLDMGADFDLKDHYQLVRDGKFTLDALNDDLKSIYSDVNGNGISDTDDRFGMCAIERTMTYFMLSGGETIVSADADGLPVFEGLSQRCVDMYEHIFDVIFANQSVFVGSRDKANSGKKWTSPFADGNCLYLFEPLGASISMRDYTFDYSILPLPKYDEQQKDYITPILEYVHTMYVTIANDETEMIGTVLENLCAESYQDLRPAYFDYVLEGKRIRDEASVEMLNIIFRNRMMHPATLYDWGKLVTTIRDQALKGNRDIVSSIASRTSIIQNEIGKTMEFYKGN